MEKKDKKKKLRCKFTGNYNGVIRQYGLNMHWRYFKENAPKLGFKKYS